MVVIIHHHVGICCICIHLNVMKNVGVLTVKSHSKSSQSQLQNQTVGNGKIQNFVEARSITGLLNIRFKV